MINMSTFKKCKKLLIFFLQSSQLFKKGVCIDDENENLKAIILSKKHWEQNIEKLSLCNKIKYDSLKEYFIVYQEDKTSDVVEFKGNACACCKIHNKRTLKKSDKSCLIHCPAAKITKERCYENGWSEFSNSAIEFGFSFINKGFLLVSLRYNSKRILSWLKLAEQLTRDKIKKK